MKKEPNTTKSTDKIARICWNTNGWQHPSGTGGKSKSKDSFEHKNGFGQEEWLFDTSNLINGYKYCHIQASNTHVYQGKQLNITLYSINNETKEYFLIGHIKSAEIIKDKTSKEALLFFEENEWLKGMQEQIKNIKGVPMNIKELKKHPTWLFNVRFKTKNLTIYYPYKEIESDSIKLFRYKFCDKNKNIINLEKSSSGRALPHKNKDKNTNDIIINKIAGFIRQPKEARIHNPLVKIIKKNFPQYVVSSEHTQKSKGRADVEIQHNNKRIVLEIKTGISARACIRRAIGQLLEYGYYNNPQKPEALVIVSDEAPQKKDLDYLELLKTELNIKFFYQRYQDKKDGLNNDDFEKWRLMLEKND